ncbi:MAG: hypothetical protein IJC36_01635 [Clostridia bacterium]|nr:hypothetical protein [Clostridia bacterium]
MKRTLFETIYNEDFIKVNIEKDELIEKLLQLKGECINDDSNGNSLYFHINKNGNYVVTSPHYNSQSHARDFYLKGKIIASKNNTSIVYAKCIRDNIGFLLGISLFIPTACLVLFCILSLGLSWALLLILVLGLGASFLPEMLRNSNEERDKTADFEIMKKEVLKRIEVVKNWDK